ncbi:hypothetical protein V1511DRAFT_461509 [Dipodascopsis uninucleata]
MLSSSVFVQCYALMLKCLFLLRNARRSTIFRAFSLPIIFSWAQTATKSLYAPPAEYGVSKPLPMVQLNDTIGYRYFAYVMDDVANDDLDKFMKNVTADLPQDQVYALNDSTELLSLCKQSLQGSSNCLSAIEWHKFDPANNEFNYTIRADAGLGSVYVNEPNNIDPYKYILPAQWRIDATLLGLDLVRDAPEVVVYTSQTQKQNEQNTRVQFSKSIVNYLSAELFLAMIGVVYQLSGMIGSERETGIASLLDSMGCSKLARYMSFVAAFTPVYLPGWIVAGVAIGTMAFQSSNMGVSIGFYILSGLSMISFTLFISLPYTRASISGIGSVGVCIVLACMCIVQKAVGPRNSATEGVLAFFFPPMNFVYFLQEVARYEIQSKPANLLHVPPEGYVAPGLFYLFAVIQFFGYFGLSTFLDSILYPSPKRSLMNSDPEYCELALKLNHVSKFYYIQNWLLNFLPVAFQPKTKNRIVAVDDLSLDIKSGQITCLLGPNGSGKTTTLEMIAGLQHTSEGTIGYSTTSVGLCPQKNVLWDSLTVAEHIFIWTMIKSGIRDTSGTDVLISSCDLEAKKRTQSRHLSGGQKRKLQLAIMFAGGSDICCIDEVSSGVDPLSRRKLWDIILSARGRASIVLTTHFLDEADVLADSIAIMTLGSLRAWGSPVQLKNDFNSGYRVYSLQPTSGRELVYNLSSPAEVIELVERLQREGHKELRVAEPQLEDIFLSIVADSDPEIADLLKDNNTALCKNDSLDHSKNEYTDVYEAENSISSNSVEYKFQRVSFFSQVLTMLWKRYIVARRNPYPTIIAILTPVIICAVTVRFLKSYTPQSCDIASQAQAQKYKSFSLNSLAYSINLALGPYNEIGSLTNGFANYALASGLFSNSPSSQPVSSLLSNVTFVNNTSEFLNEIDVNFANIFPGGLFLDNSRSMFSFVANGGSDPTDTTASVVIAPLMLNMFNNVRANGSAIISTDYSPFQYQWTASTGDSLLFIVFISLAMGAYSSFLSIYPTFERLKNVRSLHYSNGLRVLPLWISYTIFDFLVSLIGIVIVTGIIGGTVSGLFGFGYFFVVLMLFGLTATLFSYIFARFCTSQLAAFAITSAYQCIWFLIYLLTYLLVEIYVSARKFQDVLNIVYYVQAIFSPMPSLVKALFLTLNLFSSLCDSNSVQYSRYDDIRAFGAPILYLCAQSAVAFLVLVRLDSGRLLPSFRFFGQKSKKFDPEDKPSSGTIPDDIAREIERTENATDFDGLRLLHVTKTKERAETKSSGTFVAVNDVSLGVSRGECFALLGPNGAGKSLTFNMIRGEIAPTSGKIFVENASITEERNEARKYLGVCPQFDAVDHLSVHEILTFYASIRGVRRSDIQKTVDKMIESVGLQKFKNRMALRLSGGNQRKLSLAIALMGDPHVLLLDEPSSGMDAASKRVMWKTVASVSKGRSIVLTTHSMEEADVLASRAGILAQSLLAIGSSDELRSRYGTTYQVHLILDGKLSQEELQRWVYNAFSQWDIKFDTSAALVLHGQMKFSVSSLKENSEKYISTLESSSLSIISIFKIVEKFKSQVGIHYYSVSQPSLEQVFLEIVSAHNVVEEGY